MAIFNEKNDHHKRVLGDARTYATRNIPFLWSSTRYFKENIYHAAAAISLLLGIICAIVSLVIMVKTKDTEVTTSTTWSIYQIFGMITFLLLMTAVIMKLNERKIRKIRLRDTVSGMNREIKIEDKSNNS
ncbi:MAG: hypothetical protein LBC33_01270 [Mycoplasmataceae bacterium]|nr:hypothetical protein [Mycoplasmataceae bacterium]